ncbi:MAG TPA: hypothetical protein VND66_07675 [Acidobacteriaceae bacterium]|nr:hypothetical protein [Terriglobia bacterium]HVC90484.1 hypothetical protein [Acidobacteriaceae bacterium]
MIRLTRFLMTVFCLASVLLAFQGTAHAYADPGSGLLALQVIGSTLAGIGFYFRQKLGKFFIRRRVAAGGPAIKPGSPEEPPSAPESEPE